MKSNNSKTPAAETNIIEASRTFPAGIWRQYLRLTKFGGETYIDEGNGERAYDTK